MMTLVKSRKLVKEEKGNLTIESLFDERQAKLQSMQLALLQVKQGVFDF